MRAGTLTMLLVLAWPRPSAAQTDALARAHEQYNQKQYDEAIQSATEAQRSPADAIAAAIVLSRAHLERYRQSSEFEDLDAARTGLVTLDRAKLTPRERLDWTLGMGELLFLDGRFSTAAEFFDAALAQHDESARPGRERVLEWWAEALDQHAQLGPAMDRHATYRRIFERAEQELRRDAESATAGYWLAAASAGMEDFDRAWAAVEAGWLRASASDPEGARLRTDLDRLMTSVVIPSRAAALSPTGPQSTMRLLEQEWEGVKARYGQ